VFGMAEKAKMKKEEKVKQLIAQLKTGEPETIEQTIEEIGETGDSSFIVALTDFLHQTDEPELKNKILKLFGELKHSDAVDQLIRVIQNPNYEREQSALIATCWQNGLNYSPYLPYFADLVIEKEFETAFEAFTVIENMYGKIDKIIEAQTLDKIKLALTTANEQKIYFLKGLLEIIPNIPELQEDRAF
jgi:hypothetical protein